MIRHDTTVVIALIYWYSFEASGSFIPSNRFKEYTVQMLQCITDYKILNIDLLMYL